ncbi:MAG: hypothetical protein N3G22_03905 [Candidatus Micrarchaeota archaeon]|nr:hypothetical protein [Candidatus Micrarchaeota archaeon]
MATDTEKIRPSIKPIRRGEYAPPSQARKAPAPAEKAGDGGKVKSGIDGFDQLIGGGFEPLSINLVMGEAGSGKTTFLSQFLYNGAVKYGEPGVLLTFEESAESVESHMAKYGFDFKSLEEQLLFQPINYRPHEVKKLVDEGGGLILDTISSLGAKRLAIDSLTSYALLFDSAYQAREAEISLFELLKKWGCTSLLSAEGLPSSKKAKGTMGMEHLADSVTVLYHPRHQSVRFRAIEVTKLRGGKPVEKICPFELIEGVGIRVYPDEEIFYEIKEKED